MRKLSSVFLFSLILISCQEPSKPAGKMETEKVAKDSAGSLDNTVKDSVKDDSSVSLPFDFEKYTAVCLQQSSPDCEKIYPKVNDADFKKVSQILGGKSEDIPTNIFQIDSKPDSDIKVYILDFEGDSTFQEVITVGKDKIISRKSVGHSMPEEKTYKSFVIEDNMTINVYEIDFETLKKKLKEKYTILSSGEISGK